MFEFIGYHHVCESESEFVGDGEEGGEYCALEYCGEDGGLEVFGAGEVS